MDKKKQKKRKKKKTERNENLLCYLIWNKFWNETSAKDVSKPKSNSKYSTNWTNAFPLYSFPLFSNITQASKLTFISFYYSGIYI